MSTKVTRRELLAGGAALGASPYLAGCVPAKDSSSPDSRTTTQRELPVAPPLDLVRIAILGVGTRGRVHLEDYLQYGDEVEITAIGDISEENLAAAEALFEQFGRAKGAIRLLSSDGYEKFCAEEPFDLLVIASPWELHVPMAVAGMLNDKHVAIEVPAAVTVDECWQLVETAEITGKHCVMLENVNYYEDELAVLNAVRQGVLGELVHCEGGYLHDLRRNILDPNRYVPSFWRAAHHTIRNGNLYPTHGLGPLANCLNINYGDRFERMVSLSSLSKGYALAAEHLTGETNLPNEVPFVCGDYSSSIIRTALGKTIYLSFNTASPRPYSRIHMVQGTKGYFQGYPSRVFLQSESLRHQDADTDYAKFRRTFKHPLRDLLDTELEPRRRRLTHGGADAIMNYRLIRALRNGLRTDMNHYDAAALSVVGALSELSVNNDGQPVTVPDFTGGNWRVWTPPAYHDE